MRERAAVRLRASLFTGAGPLLLAATVAGCNSGAANGGHPCTDLYAYVTAVAVDSTGARLTHVTISDSVARTGHRFAVTQQQYPAGTVTVFSDSYRAELATSGDSVRVNGSSDQGSFAADYLLRDDGCHVQKVAGPDSVVAR